jgi:prepilin-type processing-associated H-X9-DG protein
MLAYGGIFHCPGKPNWSLSGPTDSERVSYGMNSFGDQEKGAPRSLADEPGITALVADIPTGNPVLRPGKNDLYDVFYAANFPQLHNGKDNVVFCDGHVEQIKKDGLDRNDSWKKKR